MVAIQEKEVSRACNRSIEPRMWCKSALLAVFAAISSATQYQLNITVWPNEPYIYEFNNTFKGTLVQVLQILKHDVYSVCGPKGLRINYRPTAKTHSHLLRAMTTAKEPSSNSTIFAFAPVLPSKIHHQTLFKHYDNLILNSPGYTLVANGITQTKMYRLVAFGFSDSATLLFLLIMATAVAGIIMWFLVSLLVFFRTILNRLTI